MSYFRVKIGVGKGIKIYFYIYLCLHFSKTTKSSYL